MQWQCTEIYMSLWGSIGDFWIACQISKLQIATGNANSLKFKLKEFETFLYSRNYDIVGICEMKFDKNNVSNIPGYNCYLSSRNSRGGGGAIIIRKNIKHTFVIITNLKNIEAVAIVLPSKNFKFKFIYP